MSKQPKFLILADGDFSPMTSKTANAVIRYRPERVVGVVDRQKVGKTVQDVLGFGGKTPVIASMKEGLALGFDVLLIGIAPAGGRLPEAWRGWILEAIEAGKEVWSGLHTFLGDDPEFSAAAAKKGVKLLDIRKPPKNLPVSTGKAGEVAPFVILTVGTDCNVGKMTAQLQLVDKLNARGVRTRFVPTGQTGIMIEGWGIGVDAVVADFIGGAAEQLVLEGAKDADIVLVEGQGSINHPGYSGVTLGLLHGSCPDALILCHQSSREHIGDYRPGAKVKIPALAKYVKWYEEIGSMVHPTKTIGLCLNTYDLDEATAKKACADAEKETGLPATDPVRFDPDKMIDAILQAREKYLASRKA
jgi:uncharacterized NAD-dependent epimerase/dehydratase family protein